MASGIITGAHDKIVRSKISIYIKILPFKLFVNNFSGKSAVIAMIYE
jgi:hypothetical protein